MKKDLLDSMQQLVTEVGENHSSTIYKNFWGIERAFSRLPVISRNILFEGPLSERRHKSARSLVKIVTHEKTRFLSEWAYEDVAREEYGAETKRPMVYLSDNAESIEKSMWCYERGMVPLIGEVHNEAVAVAMARKYQIDSLITDELSLERFRPFFENAPEVLTSISILGSRFDSERMRWVLPYAKEVRLVLTLPETGAFAQAVLEGNPVFAALPGCMIENREETLVLSKKDSLVTPIIRYNTEILSESIYVQK